jgi:type II secretory pathway pseudopilin PulG
MMRLLRPRRRGKTLVEMLVLITILSMILGGVGTTLVALFKTDRQVLRDLDQLAALSRLGSRFRTDAHAAQSCQVGESCQLTLSDGRTIDYSVAPRKISREVRRGDEVLHRDAFTLPEAAIVRFELPAESQGRLVRLVISAKEDADRSYMTAVRRATIEAAVGLAKKEISP